MTTNTKQTIINEESTVPPQDPSVQLAVVNNDVNHINATLVRIESKFDDAIKAFVTNEQLAGHQLRADDKHKEQDDRIKNLEKNQAWIVRSVIGAIVAAIIALVVMP